MMVTTQRQMQFWAKTMINLLSLFGTFASQGSCEDTEFAVDLLTELVRAFLAAHDTRAQVRGLKTGREVGR